MRSCGRAVMQSCGRAVVRSCSHAVMWSCGHAVLQSCSPGVSFLIFSLPCLPADAFSQAGVFGLLFPYRFR